MKTPVGVLIAATLLSACGSTSRREVAEKYVGSINARDWNAACEVSVHDRMDRCVELLRTEYRDPGAKTPTVAATEAVVEEVDGRNLVHFEHVTIR